MQNYDLSSETEQDNSVAPLPKKSRRWFRYSLRTFLILVTIFCVWFAVISNRARKQKLTLEKLGKLSNSYVATFDYQLIDQGDSSYKYKFRSNKAKNPLPTWLTTYIGEDYGRTVWMLDLLAVNREKPFPSDISIFEEFSDLRMLWLHTVASDDAMKHLANLTRLKYLSIQSKNVDGTGFQHFSQHTRLVGLDLNHSPITDNGLSHIAKIKSLRHLCLQDANVSDRGLEYLPQLSNLEFLVLNGSAITDTGLGTLAKMKSLKQLSIHGNSKLTTDGIEEIKKQLPNCKIIE